ncbi:DUF6468 domain-containing protein [Azospirillum halopraeferens]|uniref:DUF6468 domain-containing protein n=1 Tax=Azospirillum halopraeferens TaxID=34010 RepID=UPI000401239D|nr:DUF6468 domain-containing protein [Azospirillum halopraeferens]
MASFLIDAVLAVMLVTATVYLVIVNQRLKLLRNGQSEINALIATFSRSIDDTDASMKRLVGSATEVAGRLSGDLDRAGAIKEDMALILGSCERTTARMEESIRHARALLRRLDEGAMVRTGRRPDAPPPAAAPAVAPATVQAPAADAPAAPEVETEPGPAPADTPAVTRAPMPVFARDAAEPPGEAGAAPAEPMRPANAFYARLRTVGSEV